MEHRLLSKFRIIDLTDTKRNQRITFLCYLLSAIFLVIAACFFIANNMFRVDKIIIKGDVSKVTKTQLEYVANNKLHGTFFTLNISELQSQFKMLPRVKDVTVERVFPHTIIVKFTEYNAIARVGSVDLLADNNEVFDGADDNESLPILNVEPDKAVWAYQQYLLINKVLNEHDMNIKSIRSDNSRVLYIGTSNGKELVICTQNLSKILDKLDAYWSDLVQINPSFTYMNFCYNNSVAIK